MDEQEVTHRILDYLEELGSTLSDLAPDAQRIAMQAIYADAVSNAMQAIVGILISIGLIYICIRTIRFGRDDDDEMALVFGWMGMAFTVVIGGVVVAEGLITLLKILIAPEYMALRKLVGIFTGCNE